MTDAVFTRPDFKTLRERVGEEGPDDDWLPVFVGDMRALIALADAVGTLIQWVNERLDPCPDCNTDSDHEPECRFQIAWDVLAALDRENDSASPLAESGGPSLDREAQP